MEREYIDKLKPGQNVKICGFIEKIRDQKYMQFVLVRDISGLVQVTVEKESNANIAETISSLTVGSFVEIEGKCVENPNVKVGGKEVLPNNIEVFSIADNIPIKEDTSIDQRLDYRWVDLRSEKNFLLFKVQTELTKSFRNYLLERNFVELHTPKIIGAASESGADVFEIKYFDTKAYLAQSPQFYKQMAMASGFEKYFECGPVFRAEESYTSRHTTEFSCFDVEFSYIKDYTDVMKLEEEMIVYAFKSIKEKFGEDIQRVFGKEFTVPTSPFPRMKLSEIYDELEKRYGFTVSKYERDDLSTEAERMVHKLAKDMYNHDFMFVTDYPVKKRAFYHMRKDGVPQGYDLIYNGVEITTGAQREHRYEILKKQAQEKGLGEDVKFYLEFFRYGCPPHGGFGIGLDRLIMLMLGISSIKESMFLFRSPSRINP